MTTILGAFASMVWMQALWLPVLAQDSPAPRTSPWVTALVALGVVAAAATASLLSSRRGHQD